MAILKGSSQSVEEKQIRIQALVEEGKTLGQIKETFNVVDRGMRWMLSDILLATLLYTTKLIPTKGVIPAKAGIQEKTGFRVKPGMTN